MFEAQLLVSPTGVLHAGSSQAKGKVILKEGKMHIFMQQRHDPDNLEAAFLTFEIPSGDAVDLAN